MLPGRVRIIVVIVGGKCRHWTVVIRNCVAAKRFLRQIGGGGRLAVLLIDRWMLMPSIVVIVRVWAVSRPRVVLSLLTALWLPRIVAVATATVGFTIAFAIAVATTATAIVAGVTRFAA